MAHSTVRAVHQDRQGFLWFATESYLQRYDGYRLVPFKHDPDDPSTLSESQVTRIAEDSAGKLWLGTRGSGVNRYDPVLDRFERFLPDTDDPGRLPPGMVLAIAPDNDGTVWVGTVNGLGRLDPATGRVTRYPHLEEGGGPSHDGILDILLDGRGQLWVGSLTGLDRYDRVEDRFEPVLRDPNDAESPGFADFSALLEDSRGALWVGTWDGKLHRREAVGEPFVTFDPEPDLGNAPGRGVNTLAEDGAGDLWIGTNNRGLIHWRREDGSFRRHAHHPADSHSLTSNKVRDLVQDHSGVLWIATDSGLGRLPHHHRNLTVLRYRPPGTDEAKRAGRGLPGPDVLSLAESREGRLWIGTLGNGLTRFDPTNNTFDTPDKLAARGTPWSHGAVRALHEDRLGTLWIGTGSGLLSLDPESRLDRRQGIDSLVNVLLEDGSGRLWVGSGGQGIFCLEGLDRTPRQLIHDPEAVGGHAANQVYALLEDGPDQLWAGTEGGLTRIEISSGALEHRRHVPGQPGPSSDNIVALHLDDRGDLWLGSYGGGLDHWDRSADRWHNFRERDGLPSDKVVSILADEHGILWLATNGGLARVDPVSHRVRRYDADDGLHGNVFFIGSGLRSRSGALVFGGPGGLSLFRPEQLHDSGEPPQILLTELRLRDEVVHPSWRDTTSPLERTILFTDRLGLDYRSKTVAFELAALHYASPLRNRYAYRLVGWDDAWIEVDASQRRVRYTNLDPGSYLFEVKGSNKDGVWSDPPRRLELSIEAPPWRTPWAYTLYTLGLLAVVFGAWRFQHHRLLREQAISARLREVDRMKDELVANTSHELRTPLMGITGIAEALIGGIRGELPPRVVQDLALVVSSGRRLGSLVDDLLDFSKLEGRRITLAPHPLALHTLVERVLALCQPILGESSPQLINRVGTDLPLVSGDEHRLQQVLLNLVGNAIKFSTDGRVTVSAERSGNRIEIAVEDDGPGIPPEHQERIFEAFEQADASIERAFGGTGLGLAVSRRLVELHGGRLGVESDVGRGARFFFDLPLAEEMDAKSSPAPRITEANWAAAAKTSGSNLPSVGRTPSPKNFVGRSVTPPELADEVSGVRVLVVDDEEVNRKVLESFLHHPWVEVATAGDGREALELADSGPFDLVLLDIMMPQMSGYEVCRRLRQRHSIEELPILFLTAKGAGDDVVTGLSLGANDYLVKPVGKDELLARLRPHLDLLQVFRQQEERVEHASTQLHQLRGLLPMCASCKKIRDDAGYWSEVETFIAQNSDAELSHSLCPDCVRRHYGDYAPDDLL